MVALLTALALSGRSPGLPELNFEPHGIVAAPPSDHNRRRDQDRRGANRFPPHQGRRLEFRAVERTPVPAELASHLDMALHFMHVSEPTRSLDPSDYEAANFAEFGLDPPAYLVSLEQPDRSAIVADFGTLKSVGYVAVFETGRSAHGPPDATPCRNGVGGHG